MEAEPQNNNFITTYNTVDQLLLVIALRHWPFLVVFLYLFSRYTKIGFNSRFYEFFPVTIVLKCQVKKSGLMIMLVVIHIGNNRK